MGSSFFLLSSKGPLTGIAIDPQDERCGDRRSALYLGRLNKALTTSSSLACSASFRGDQTCCQLKPLSGGGQSRPVARCREHEPGAKRHDEGHADGPQRCRCISVPGRCVSVPGRCISVPRVAPRRHIIESKHEDKDADRNGAADTDFTQREC